VEVDFRFAKIFNGLDDFMSNITEKKSYEFAVRIVKLYKHLNDTKKEYVMATDS